MIKRTIKNLLADQGVQIRHLLPPQYYCPAFDMLRPVETGIPLVRIGSEFDGGYLVPDDLDGIAACFSPGVADIADFECEMLERGIGSFQIDGSVEMSPVDHPMIRFERKFLGMETHGDEISMDDWVAQNAPGDSDLILQIDIEGAEWLALAATSLTTLRRFRIIVIELHHLHLLADECGVELLTPLLRRLTREFHVVHLHANNGGTPCLRSFGRDVPQIVEATLLRKDRSKARGFVARLPHPLDRPNVPQFPPLDVPQWMYG